MFVDLGDLLSRYVQWYTDFSPHSQFAPFFSETFRPQIILRKHVSPPPHKKEGRSPPPRFHSSGRRFTPKPYFRKTFRTQTIFQKNVSHPNHISERRSHPNHISERRFVHKSYLGKTFRTYFIIRKDVSPPLHILERCYAP